jgi:hypothetical protein
MVVTAHFVNENWVLQKKVLSFSVVPPPPPLDNFLYLVFMYQSDQLVLRWLQFVRKLICIVLTFLLKYCSNQEKHSYLYL